MSDKGKLLDLCLASMKEKGLYKEPYKTRFKDEYEEICNQGMAEYFLSILGNRYPYNEHNCFTSYLLGLVPDFDICKETAFTYGEFPDIDIDYLDSIKDYLAAWLPTVFGEKRVTSIGNYAKFGVKSSLLDMTRVHGQHLGEMQAITKEIGLKDEDGGALTLDQAIAIYPKLKEYAERHPDIINATRRLMNRKRSKGKHAGGIIISSVDLEDIVPLMTDTDGMPVSAYVQGQADQDLEQLGLIKFDVLAVKDLERIACIKRLIKQRHGIESLCALPGGSDWSDEAYLNDPLALSLADRGDLKGVFQFDSDMMRELCRSGGVTRFEDLPSYSAIGRPGPLGVGFDKRYIERKRGREKYDIHPLFEPILGKTYGVILFQEQITQLFQVLGVPKTDCEVIRRAISKKKEKIFLRYKDTILKNGQAILGWSLEQITEFWEQILSFAEYGFSKNHAFAYAVISSRLLYPKAHYPIEFFAGTLACKSGGKIEKLQMYRLDAALHNFDVRPVDLTKSDVNFSIQDEKIYSGFINIKGIGKDVAERIVAHKPYTGIEDFLARFGTQAQAVTSLISLGLFGEDRAYLMEFYDYYKKAKKSREDAVKRAEKSQEKYRGEILAGLVDKSIFDRLDSITYDKPKDFLAAYPAEDKEVFATIKKLKRNLEGYQQKLELANSPILMKDFVPTGEIEEKYKTLFNQPLFVAEQAYYGFGLSHPLKESPDYEPGKTFLEFENPEKVSGPVICQVIEKPKQHMSKNGTIRYTVRLEDENFAAFNVVVWKEDYERFATEFEYWDEEQGRGAMLKVRIKRPEKGFISFTFESFPRQMRWKIPKEKKLDYRLTVLKFPPKNDLKALLDD